MAKYSNKRQIGNLGEALAEVFLVKHGHRVLDRNYLKKWGEIDLVTRETPLLHFVEVKSVISRYPIIEDGVDKYEYVSRLISQNSFTPKKWSIRLSSSDVTNKRENKDSNSYRPEESVHYWKQKRIIRAINTYLAERGIDDDIEWQIDIITVSMDFHVKTAIINHIANVIFD